MTQPAKIPTSNNMSTYQNNFSVSCPDQSMAYAGTKKKKKISRTFFVLTPPLDPRFYTSSMAKTSGQTNDSYYYETPISTFSTSPTKVTVSPSSIMIQEPPVLVASSSSTTTASTMSSSSVEFLNEAFAKASSLPESFYPEFLQYSKETYEQSTGGGPHRRKQKNTKEDEQSDDEVNQ